MRQRSGADGYGEAFLKALAGMAAIVTGTPSPISVRDVNARV